MTGAIGSYTTLQRIPQKKVNGTISDTTTAQYTCPTGKKAILSITAVLVAYGAGGNCGVKFGGTQLIFFVSPGDAILTSSKTVNNISLAAGDTVVGADSGAGNPTINYAMSIQESDA